MAKIESGELNIFPEKRKNEIINIIKEKQEHVSFSRPKEKLSWGVPVPNDPDHVMYVWCDALTNYLSSLDYDNYINFLKKQSNRNNSAGLLSNKQVKKAYTKILESPKKIEKARNKHLALEKQITAQVFIQSEEIGKSMYDFINKESSDDW